MSEKPVMKSITEFVDYLATHLGMVRCMRKLSRDDPFFIQWDELMGERWCSVINGRCPTPEQRRAALEERHNVAEILPRVMPATRDLLVMSHSLHVYVVALPAPGASGGGWDVRADLLHPDSIVKMLTACLDDAKRITALDGDNPYYKALLDQFLEMARWTRTSLNPTAEDRAKVNLGAVTQQELDDQLKAVIISVCRSMHDFCDLYANFPVLPPVPKMNLG